MWASMGSESHTIAVNRRWHAAACRGVRLDVACACARGGRGLPPPRMPRLLPLIECRLEHPLHLTSIPARCGTLRVPLDREHPKEGSIDLKVAVVPALNRRSTAAPLVSVGRRPGTKRHAGVRGAQQRLRAHQSHARHRVVGPARHGNSNPQSCVYPEDWQEPADPMPALRKATLDCLAKLGPAGALLHHQHRGPRFGRCARGIGVTTRSICTAARTARASRNSTCAATRRTSTR